ncbi:MAG: hypothetical protein IKT31_06775 [Firmicutes bacterium]|nr:hypothetical protein [Bacillota bacterium]
MKKNIKGFAAAAMLLAAMAVCFGCSSADSDKVPTPYDEYNLEECIRLADYSGYKYEMPEISVTEEEIDQHVQVLLKEETTYDEIRTGTVKDGDKIHISYTADCEGERVFTNEGYAVTMGKGYLSEELEAALLGQDVGAAVETSTKIPEDFSMNPTLAGKEVVYTITIEFIYDEHIPVLDEKFVQNTSEYKTVGEYRESVRRLIIEEKMEDMLDEQFETVWTKMVNESEVLEYPEGALDTERLYFYSSYSAQLPADAEQAEVEKLCEEFAKESVKQKLVLYAIAEAEDLVPTVKEYKAELNEYLAEMDFTEETFEETYSVSIYEYAIANDWISDYLYGEAAELLMGEER